MATNPASYSNLPRTATPATPTVRKPLKQQLDEAYAAFHPMRNLPAGPKPVAPINHQGPSPADPQGQIRAAYQAAHPGQPTQPGAPASAQQLGQAYAAFHGGQAPPPGPVSPNFGGATGDQLGQAWQAYHPGQTRYSDGTVAPQADGPPQTTGWAAADKVTYTPDFGGQFAGQGGFKDTATGRPAFYGPNGEPGYYIAPGQQPPPGLNVWTMPDGRTVAYQGPAATTASDIPAHMGPDGVWRDAVTGKPAFYGPDGQPGGPYKPGQVLRPGERVWTMPDGRQAVYTPGKYGYDDPNRLPNAPTQPLEADPQYLAFLRAAGLEDSLAQAQATQRTGSANAELALRLPQLARQGAVQREGISGAAEARGMFFSGGHERDLARQRSDEATNTESVRNATADAIAQIQQDLAQSLAGTSRERDEQALAAAARLEGQRPIRTLQGFEQRGYLDSTGVYRDVRTNRPSMQGPNGEPGRAIGPRDPLFPGETRITLPDGRVIAVPIFWDPNKDPNAVPAGVNPLQAAYRAFHPGG